MSSEEESEHLFSYGTLQDEAVQQATFGRRLVGKADALIGYRQTRIEIHDTWYPNVQFSGRDSDVVVGTRFKVTGKELEQADIYEADDYKRILVELKSGTQAWVYVSDEPALECASLLAP